MPVAGVGRGKRGETLRRILQKESPEPALAFSTLDSDFRTLDRDFRSLDSDCIGQGPVRQFLRFAENGTVHNTTSGVSGLKSPAWHPGHRRLMTFDVCTALIAE
ncbi:hypothetical protein JOB18_013314 [Solea senegalensis]|uniref:Uncharacterized protein n=1 Tax=Solea senegalensis TaxID=28829 RepID=A0AAV6RSM6_SOLSE|nr:hypothetical protein JOB18_013314 [Solea senegalensis]